jgi:chorismate dehydratase
MKKLKMTAVSYLNTKPLLYGLVQSSLEKHIDISLDIPSVCARKLQSGEADFGLVPVAIIPELDTPHIISDYCIGATGRVATVSIFSQVPLDEVTHLYLDYHSRTSVALTKLLLKKHWQLSPILLPATEGFEAKINGSTAALIIGDRAIGLEEKYAYTYDLAEAWMQWTGGLPFVFAAWVSNTELSPHFVERLNRAFEEGIAHIPQLVYLLPSPHPNFNLKRYFLENISYHLDTPKRMALDLFLSEIQQKVTA